MTAAIKMNEPEEFGSIVLARLNDASFTTRVRWVCLPAGWQSEDGEYECPYSWLRDVEVIRVGIGEADSGESGGVAWAAGFGLAKHHMYRELERKRSEALTGERQNAYDVMLKFVEGLEP